MSDAAVGSGGFRVHASEKALYESGTPGKTERLHCFANERCVRVEAGTERGAPRDDCKLDAEIGEGLPPFVLPGGEAAHRAALGLAAAARSVAASATTEAQ